MMAHGKMEAHGWTNSNGSKLFCGTLTSRIVGIAWRLSIVFPLIFIFQPPEAFTLLENMCFHNNCTAMILVVSESLMRAPASLRLIHLAN